jgi:ABC-type multidrug transport system permease subunit
MLGLLLIYWIGKFFYQLAEKNNQNKWLFAILGIAVFYITQFIFALILVFLNEFGITNVDLDSYALNLIGIPLGFLGCYIFYILLEKSWKKDVVDVSEAIQDIGNPELD